jgi:hypothetical protein
VILLLDDPILHGGLEYADIFQCLAPHRGAFLFQKDVMEVTTPIKKKRWLLALSHRAFSQPQRC